METVQEASHHVRWQDKPGITTRVSEGVKTELERRATQRDNSLARYVARVLADHVGMEP